MCDICRASRDKVEAFITEEMKANAAAHEAEYRESDDVRLLIDLLLVKFSEKGALLLLPATINAAVRLRAQMIEEAAAEQGGDLKGVILSPAPKTVQ